jgi:hypothetical protein
MNAHDAEDSARNPLPPLRRRRSFLASRPDESIETGPFLIETVADPFPIEAQEDSIPVLTEVVSVEEESETPEDLPAPEGPFALPAMSGKIGSETPEELVARMTRAVGEQMAYELPTLIEASLLSICKELCNGITSTMDAALRDFAERHKQETKGS